MKITANIVGYVASPLIAAALAFGGMQYTKGRDDLILETMIAKLDQIELSELRGMREDIDEMDKEFENEIEEMAELIGYNFEDILNLRNDVIRLQEKIGKLD